MKHETEGTKEVGQAHALVNLFILLALPIASVVLAVVVGTALVNPSGSARLALAFYVFGFVLFLIAKISVFRSGRLLTFGAQLMRPGYRALYRAGYVLMVAGALCRRPSRHRKSGVDCETWRPVGTGRARSDGQTLTMPRRLTSDSGGRRLRLGGEIGAIAAAAQPDRWAA